MKKYILATAVIAASLTFTGCTQDEENLALAGAGVAAVAVAASNSSSNYHSDGSYTGNYYHSGYNYGSGRNYAYRDGVRDGCTSRRGRWIQPLYRWENDYNYKSGWQAGYRRCR